MNQNITRPLREAGEHERAGRISSALSILIRNKGEVSNTCLEKIYNSNLQRLFKKAQKRAKLYYLLTKPEPIFENKKNPRNYAEEHQDKKGIFPPIISLTTISSRIHRIEETIKSISTQTREIHSINLYISHEPYLIDEGIKPDNPVLKKIANMGVNIYLTKNIGPYRKQLPLIIQLRSTNASPRTPIITIDDDVIYPEDIVEKLTQNLEEENAVVAHRGREILLENKRLAIYKKFPAPSLRSSFLNMGTGKNGIAYRLGYFPTNPEDFLGQIIAPTADDIWCKWVTAAYCIPTIILEPAAAYDASLDFKESDPNDKNGLFYNYNAKGTNDDAIENLESYFLTKGTGITSLFGEKNG